MIKLDSRNPTPFSEQIRSQLAATIHSGSLARGQRLPSVRQLAADLRIAPGTVARAFKELDAACLIESTRSAGTLVRLDDIIAAITGAWNKRHQTLG